METLAQERRTAVRQDCAQEARQASVRNLLVAACVAEYLGLWYLAIVVTPEVAPLALLIACALALTALCLLVRRRPEVTKGSFMALVYVVTGWGVVSGHAPAYLLALPAMAAGAAYGAEASLVGGLAMALLAWITSPGGGLLPPLFLAGVGLVSWLSLAPMVHLLAWHSRRSLEATSLAEQLKDQRGTLNRTIKDLDASYKLLQQTNHDLAVARREAETLHELRHGFATNLSHELRTPLNIITGFAQLVYVNPALYGYDTWSEALRRDLAEIRRNAGYLSDLVDDIIDLARVDALAMPIQRQLTDLRALIGESLEAVDSLARAKGLALAVHCPRELPAFEIDPLRIKQVLVNLLTNAVRYTEHGSVDLRVSLDDEYARISVSDTGCGIPAEELATVFNEFYQVGRPKTGRSSGKGLGLAIAKRLVHLHGGSIWAESETDRGSTFHFTLPLGSKRVGLLRRSAEAALPRSSRRPTVVVIDDDGMAASYLSRRIEEYDFRSVDGTDDVARVAACEAASAVIVNSATGLHHGRARECLLASLSEGVPLISCSLPSTSWIGSRQSLAAVLSKPVSAEGLLATIASVVDKVREPRLLLVDDDRGFVQLIRRMLEASPDRRFYVRTAYTGQDALAKMLRFVPDALILDLVMPGMSGFEVVEAMRRDERLRGVPIVAVTAATPGEDRIATEGIVFTVAKRGSLRPGELIRLIACGLRLADSSVAVVDDRTADGEWLPGGALSPASKAAGTG